MECVVGLLEAFRRHVAELCSNVDPFIISFRAILILLERFILIEIVIFIFLCDVYAGVFLKQFLLEQAVKTNLFGKRRRSAEL